MTKPDTIVFGISRLTPRADKDADPETALTELRSLANVIEGAYKCGVSQLVYCSSGGAIYGDSHEPHLETDSCAPKSLYGQLKVLAENLANALCDRLGTRTAILRIGNPYGPGQSPFGLHGVIPIFIYKMLTSAPITIFGSLDAAKDYVFIDDVSAAIVATIERRASGVFNIASGTPTTLGTLVKRISEVCSVEPELEYRALPSADVPAFVLDVRKARLDLQWTPTTDMEFGIDRMSLS